MVLHGSSVHGIHGDVPSSVRCSRSAMIIEARLLSEAISHALHCFTCTKRSATCAMQMLACIHIDAMDTRLHIDRMSMRMGLRLGRYLCGHIRINVWPCVEAMSYLNKYGLNHFI